MPRERFEGLLADPKFVARAQTMMDDFEAERSAFAVGAAAARDGWLTLPVKEERRYVIPWEARKDAQENFGALWQG